MISGQKNVIIKDDEKNLLLSSWLLNFGAILAFFIGFDYFGSIELFSLYASFSQCRYVMFSREFVLCLFINYAYICT